MRRYGLPPPVNVVPGTARRQDVQLGAATEATVESLAAPAGDCVPDITGLFWRSPTTGEWKDPAVEALVSHYWLEPIGPDWVFAARLEGELCCCKPVFSYEWIPATPGDPEPPILISGNLLLVYPQVDSSSYVESVALGVLEVTAQCGDYTSAPITLTIAEEANSYGY